MNVEIEDQLRNELRQRAGGLPGRSDPYALVHGRIVRSARRRTGALVVCAVVLLVTAVLTVPGLLDGGKRNSVVNTPSPRVDGSAGSPMQWPTRGSLAGDRAYVQRAAGWLAARASMDSNQLQASDVNVLYAGDVAGRRLIVGAYQVEGESRPVQVVSLAGEAGSAKQPSESPWPWASRSPDFDHLVAFLLRSPKGKQNRPTTVVVLPGSSVRALTYSLQPAIQPDGDIERRWTPLVDEDSEPGVVTATLDDGELAPGAFRIGASLGAGEQEVQSQPYDFTIADDVPRTSLREMAERETKRDGGSIGQLAPALRALELSDLGSGEITSLRVPWRYERNAQWIGLEIGLAGGGVVEGVLTTWTRALTVKGAGMEWESPLYAVRAVPADLAGREPFFWPDPGVDSCKVHGYVPERLAATEFPDARVAAAEVVIEGERSNRSAVTNGRPVTVDYCDLLSKVDPGSIAALEIRLLDENGKKLWSGSPTPTYDKYPRELDVQ